MSNLSIILCVALCVSAGNAFSWFESLKNAQELAQKLTEDVIAKLDEEFVATQLKTHSVAAELKTKTDAFTSKIQFEAKSVVENVNKAIDESIHEAEEQHVNVEECVHAEDRNALDGLAKAVIDITETCVSNKVETALGYLEDISNSADKVIVEIEEAREANKHCGDDMHDAKSALAGILCTKKSATAATWSSLKTAPQLALTWTKAKFLVASVNPALSLCTKNERLTLFKESALVRTRSELCIVKKIAEAHDATTESH